MTQWEVVIGLETHAQLSTRSKIFSGASIAFGAEPNSQACAVDLGLPGVLPVPNHGAVERAIRFGLAVGASIAPRSVFARKNYFYPDLPKGYQISQYELPVVVGGAMRIETTKGSKQIRLTRAHLEEDAGKSLHEDFQGLSGVDLNRAGTPLLEIVTEPDMRSAEDAVAYARALHALVRWIDICDGNMQEGSFRCDVNVSVRPVGQTEYGTRCEIKNLNSFRFIERAIECEVKRQIELIEEGGKVVQQTRLYDPERDETRAMRSKEDAQDYRYFPDPDLPALVIAPEWIAEVAAALPELPEARHARYVQQLGLSAYDATLLTATREAGDYFEAVRAASPEVDVKVCANWVNGDLAAALNRAELDFAHARVTAVQLGGLLQRIADATVSGKIAKEIFEILWREGGTADDVIDARGLRQISDSGALETILRDLLARNPAQVAEYRGGKEKVFGFFVGQAMKASQGKANPAQLNALLRDLLAG